MMIIRPLQYNDVNDLIHLATVSFADEYLAQGATAASFVRQMRLVTRGKLIPFRVLTKLAGIRWELWVAELDGKVVGCGGFTGRQQMELSNLMVLPELRRQGIGQALLTKRLERIKTLGYPLAKSTILASNAASLGNARKQGLNVFDRYVVLEKSLPLLDSPESLTARKTQPDDLTFFQELEKRAVNPETLAIQGTAVSAYFPTTGSRLLDKLTGNQQQATVFSHNGQRISFSLAHTNKHQSKGTLARPILSPDQYDWYPNILHTAAAWMFKLGKTTIQVGVGAEHTALLSTMQADGWIQTQSWLRLVKKF